MWLSGSYDVTAPEYEISQSSLASRPHLCDQIAGMQERINRLEDALEARHREDAERAARDQQFEEEPLSLPPGDPPSELDPVIATDQPAEVPAPAGDLHDVPAKDEGELSELPEPPLGVEDQGFLPEGLAKFSELPDPPEPKGSVFPQPIAISLNEE